jgi:hypothetical protein
MLAARGKARPPIVGCPRCNGGGQSQACMCKTDCGYPTCGAKR